MFDILWLVIIILVVLWLLGWFIFNLGAVVHILLVVALVLLVIQIFRQFARN